MRLHLILITTAIYLAHVPVGYADDNRAIFCSKLGELAGRSMAARLSGTPVENLLKVKFDPAVHETFQTVIIGAYTHQLDKGDNAFVKNMSDYRNAVEEKCLTPTSK